MAHPEHPDTTAASATPPAAQPRTALHYHPELEQPEDDEAETVAGLMQNMRKISETVHRDEGHAYRSVHAKTHGLLTGEVVVLPNLPDTLAQGVFAEPRSYGALIRLSTVPGDLLDDSVSTPRGMALKLIGVQGARLPGSEGHVTQDFVAVNGAVFSAPTAKKFLANLKLLASTTDKAPGLKKALSTALQGVVAVAQKVGIDTPSLMAMGGHPETHPLGETYFTQVPTLYGPYMAKLRITPTTSELRALKDAPVDLKDKPDGLRLAVMDFFAQHGGSWDIQVQLCTDIETMPIEDASVEWPQEQSPYVTVARLVVPPQPAWSLARATVMDDGLSFTPWHGVLEHRPIGSIMRVRKAAYDMAARFRSEHNAQKVQEPRDVPVLD